MQEATNQTQTTQSSNTVASNGASGGWMKDSPAPTATKSEGVVNDTSKGTQSAATGETKFPENWKDILPEDLRNDPSMGVIHDVQSLAKSYINAQKMIGKNKIAVPDPKFATDEDYQGVFKALGLPEKLDDYKVDVKPDANLDPDFIKTFKENAYKSGILPKQAQKLIDWYTEASKGYAENIQKEFQAKQDEMYATLKKQWGVAYQKHEEAAALAVRDLATPEQIEYMNSRGFTSDPVLLEIFSKVGLSRSEDQMPGAEKRTGNLMAPAQAQATANQILSDATHPYHNKNHPKHAEAVEEVKRLFAMAYPEEK